MNGIARMACLIFLMAFTLLPTMPLHTSPSTPTPKRSSSFSLQAPDAHAAGQLVRSVCSFQLAW